MTRFGFYRSPHCELSYDEEVMPVRRLPAMGVLCCWIGACDTVDLGTSPAEVNACRPSQQFYYERIWPEFLSRDFAGKHCSDSGCHHPSSARHLVLPTPTSTPTLPLPADWAAIYRSTANQMSCTNAGAS